MKAIQIDAAQARALEPIHVNRDETKAVDETDPEVHHLLVWKGGFFPLEKAVNLGLLQKNGVQAKVVEQSEETKVVEVGSTKAKK